MHVGSRGITQSSKGLAIALLCARKNVEEPLCSASWRTREGAERVMSVDSDAEPYDEIYSDTHDRTGNAGAADGFGRAQGKV